MDKKLLEIIHLYELGEIHDIKLIRQNENLVYKVTSSNGCYVLRIHESASAVNIDFIKNGLDSVASLNSELEILEYLSQHSFAMIQRPIRNKKSNLLTHYNDQMISVLKWIDGESVENIVFDEHSLFEIGVVIGKIHKNLKNHSIEPRINYGVALIQSIDCELNNALKLGHIDLAQHGCMKEILDKIKVVFSDAERDGNTQFVHADLGKSNIIRTNKGELLPIDFSMSGKCISEYDLASAYLHFEKDRQGKRNSLLDGYRTVYEGNIDEMKIQLCICYQIVIFITCQHNSIFSQPWFHDALNYWCNGVMKNTLAGKSNQDMIGIYQA